MATEAEPCTQLLHQEASAMLFRILFHLTIVTSLLCGGCKAHQGAESGVLGLAASASETNIALFSGWSKTTHTAYAYERMNPLEGTEPDVRWYTRYFAAAPFAFSTNRM